MGGVSASTVNLYPKPYTCRCGEAGLTAEQQRELTAAAAAKADAAAAAAGAVTADAAAAAAGAAAVRAVPLGCDRSGALYWDLHCAKLLTGASLVQRLGASSRKPVTCIGFALDGGLFISVITGLHCASAGGHHDML